MGKGTCDSCRHYRPSLERNAPAQALHWLADSAEPDVYEELKRIATEEHERSRAETERCTENRHAATDLINDYLREREWPEGEAAPDFWKPPTLSDAEVTAFNREVKPRLPLLFVREPQTVTHCAVHAERAVFYIPELKNWAGTCGDHQPRANVPRCRQCTFYVKSGLEAQLRADASSLITAIGANDQAAAAVLERGAGRIDGGMGPAKARSLKTAYNLRGRLLEPLPYLPYCEAPCTACATGEPRLSCTTCHGEEVQRAQPEIFNRFLGCQVFQPRTLAAPLPAAVAAPPRPGPFPLPSNQGIMPALPTIAPRAPVTTAVSSLGLSPFAAAARGGAGGSRSSNLVESFTSDAVEFVFDKLREVGAGVLRTNRDEHEIPPAQLAVVVPGRPPLTNEMLRRSIAVAASLYESGMPDETQREYSTFVGSLWQRQLEQGIGLQLALIQMYDDDRSNPAWASQASRLVNELAAWSNAAADRDVRPAAAPPGQPPIRPASADVPSVN